MSDGNLPGVIVEDILRRLPVKTLITFTAVCKSWFSLISSPNFILTHLSRNSVDPQNHYLLLHRPCRDTVTISPLNFSAIPSPSTFSIPVQNPLPSSTPICVGIGGLSIAPAEVTRISPYSLVPMCGGGTVVANRSPLNLRLRLVGSINGLVCFGRPTLRPTNLVIWNPATRKFKDILVPHLKNLYNPFRIYVAFAFDSVHKDYKVVCVYRFRSGLNADMSFRFSMYSCNTDSWKEIQPDFLFRLDFISGCVTVKGNPYWMGFYREKEIWLSVDVQTEAIRVFPRPEYDRNVATTSSLMNLNDSVAQIVYSPGVVSNHTIHVYTLDENSGVWSKLYTMGSIPLQSPLQLQCCKNGEFVIKDSEGKLFMYDPISEKLKDLGIGEGMEAHYMAINYSESLVAIGGMECVGEEAGQVTAFSTSRRIKASISTNVHNKNFSMFYEGCFECFAPRRFQTEFLCR